MIREEHDAPGLSPRFFRIFDAEDAKALLQDLMMREASADAGDELSDVQMTHLVLEECHAQPPGRLEPGR